jgi:hypothetical protein
MALRGLDMEQKMAKRARRTHSSAFKAKVALAALAGDKALASVQTSGASSDFTLFVEVQPNLFC